MGTAIRDTQSDTESWRNELLRQSLRETAEELGRRRQTLKEVRARHATERRRREIHEAGDDYCCAVGEGVPRQGLSRFEVVDRSRYPWMKSTLRGQNVGFVYEDILSILYVLIHEVFRDGTDADVFLKGPG